MNFKMNVNNDKEKMLIESELKKLNITKKNYSPINNHENCYNPDDKKLWCKECVPRYIIEGWTSENHDIDKFIKETIYNAKYYYDDYYNGDSYSNDDIKDSNFPIFLEWVPFDNFENIKQIGEGGFAKVYSAIWINGRSKYDKQDDGSWEKRESEPMRVALKRLNNSQNISAEYLNELKTHWNYNKLQCDVLKFYGMTKDPETKEFMMIIEFSEKGNLRSFLLNDFINITYDQEKKFGYEGKEIRDMFEKADKEIPNISTLYEKDPDAIYTGRVFTFGYLSKPINSSVITSYLSDESDNKGCQDSQLIELEVSSSL
ncbi:kinase-like domain-containing protein [Rhizophagus irregularis DAOM 181602=DAOM 197198]|nr:kinase-like domain-containing protein [Rhizophagus irregularis DAOM 181602=DAOM 197198]